MTVKEHIRDELLKIRKQQTISNLIKKSNEIEKKLFDLPIFKESNKILFYVSYGKEVFTHEMIIKSLKQGKTVVVPKSNLNENEINIFKINSFDELSIGAYNILEPIANESNKIKYETIQLIIIPGLGFDRTGGRIGHGKGYYDKFLIKTLDTCKIGLCFEFQLLKEIPMDQNDIKMDIIITEEKVIICNNKFKSQSL
jgi:5-formyltetrahydrofolate cyclo-ligase